MPKKEKITPTVNSTPARDYSKYASATEVPTQLNRRIFDAIKVSGKIERDVDEKRLPATAMITLLTQPKEGDKSKRETITLPFSLVPIKYRTFLEQKAKDDKGTVVKFSSEYNGRKDDTVTITVIGANGQKDISAPMTVDAARRKYVDDEGKSLLREVVRIYALYQGRIVRFRVNGSAVWESQDISGGKTDASRKQHDTISQYLQKFAATDPYFLYEMNVDAVYRDHKAITYYRPTFTRGKRIDIVTEDAVIGHLENLDTYFKELDEEIKNYKPLSPEAVTNPDAVDVFDSEETEEDF